MATIMTSQPIDHEQPLPNKSQEMFCQEYLKMDLDGEVRQAKARRIEAYKRAYPGSIDETNSVLNTRAVALLRLEHVSARLKYLYEQNGAGIEAEVKWTKDKAEDVLIDIIFGNEKTENKLKALTELNKLRGIEAPKKEVEEEKQISTVESFFNKLKGGK